MTINDKFDLYASLKILLIPVILPKLFTPMYLYGVISFTYVKLEDLAKLAAIEVFPEPA